MQNLVKNVGHKLVKNEIPLYVSFLSKYLSTPLNINEDEYITEQELKINREKIYKWSQLPHINCRLPSYNDIINESNKTILFTKPKYFKNSNKNS